MTINKTTSEGIGYIDPTEYKRTQELLDNAEENLNAMKRNNKECLVCGNDGSVVKTDTGDYLCHFHKE